MKYNAVPRMGKKDLEVAKATTGKLVEHFRGQFVAIARRLGVQRQVVYGWNRRGFVSAPAACVIHNWGIPGVTRERLRPDVMDWEWQIKRATEELGYEVGRQRKAG